MQTTSLVKGGVQALPVVPISAELIRLLEQMIPVQAILPTTTMQEIMYEAGRQSVLHLLRVHHERNHSGAAFGIRP